MRPDSMHTALITGATSGIGRALSEQLARDRCDLIVNARHGADLRDVADRLERRFGISVVVVAQDLSQVGAPQEMVAELEDRSIQVDTLVNCAGSGLRGWFVETDLETELAMMRVNMVALTVLTKLLLPSMVERGSGRILNVASTASYSPGPLMAVYYATKAYVLSFSQAIASELEGSGVTVTALCPGPTDTEFQERANQERTWLLYLLREMEPEAVAQAGYTGMIKGRRVVVPGLQNKLTVLLERFAPQKLLTDVVRELHKRRDA